MIKVIIPRSSNTNTLGWWVEDSYYNMFKIRNLHKDHTYQQMYNMETFKEVI